MLALPAESLILVPVVIDANHPNVKNGPGTWLCPVHTGLLHTVLEQVVASAFGDVGADGLALSQVLVVAHATRG